LVAPDAYGEGQMLIAARLVIRWLFVRAVEDAGGSADVHVERDAVVGVAGHAGHVGGVELPGEQCGSAENVPQ
jgi:hypothetical protein